MFTDKRLTEVYKNAQRKSFNKNSKFVIFSDIHRGNDSVSDEFTRNQTVLVHALDYYYANEYTYIEAGDGDELWEYPNFRHIRMAHGDIFTVIKKFFDSDRFIMLYGNHNVFLKKKAYVKYNYYRYYDEYKESFFPLFPRLKPLEGLVLKHTDTKQELFIVHGHQGDLINDQLWPVSMMLLRHFWRYLHVVGFRNPASPARNLEKQHKIEKAFRKWIRNHKRVLICGHTHRPRFPKVGETPYFNSGCCIHTKGLTGIEIQNNQISMVEWRMMAEDDGRVRITRTIVRGPEPLTSYSFKK